MNRTTKIAHLASVALMGLFVLVVTADGFAQSYAGLHRWAMEQGLESWKADGFPLLVDLFILIGELGLFALALEGHRLTRRGLSWVDMALPFGLASAGWGVSLAFNVGAVHGWTQQVTAAVAPIASMLGLLVLLRTLHRLVTREPERAELESWPLPTLAAEPVAEQGQEDGPAPLPEVELPAPGTPALPAGPAVPEPHTAPRPAVPEPRAVPAWEDVPEDVLAAARDEFADKVAAGKVPGIRPIKSRLRVGQPRAGQVQAYLTALAAK